MDMCTPRHNVYPGASQNPDAPAPWPGARSELSQCIALVLLVFVLLAAAALTAASALWGALFSYGAMLTQLWAPMARADRAHQPISALGLHQNGLWQQGGAVLALCCLLLPLWALGFTLSQPLWRDTLQLPTEPGPLMQGLPFGALYVVNQVLGIALPEEVFWRGYVQPVLQASCAAAANTTPEGDGPHLATGIGSMCGMVLATALFAVGHVVGGAGLLALGTFFPGLMFAMLRNRYRSIVGAIALHAACNVAAAVLLQGFGAV